MARVPLQTNSPLSYIKTVDEATTKVASWPQWKRERLLFSSSSSSSNEKPSNRRGQESQAQQSLR